MNVARFIYLALLTLWVGGLWLVGFYIAPTVFVILKDNHVLAGEITGHFFAAIGWIGVVAAIYMLAFKFVLYRRQAWKMPAFWIVVVMLVIVLDALFHLQPLMAQLKAQALPLPVMQSAYAVRFDFWHHVTEVTYTITSLLGAALIWIEYRAEH